MLMLALAQVTSLEWILYPKSRRVKAAVNKFYEEYSNTKNIRLIDPRSEDLISCNLTNLSIRVMMAISLVGRIDTKWHSITPGALRVLSLAHYCPRLGCKLRGLSAIRRVGEGPWLVKFRS